jgi:hypothetical protein
MKARLIASLTLGACLLLPTARVVLAANPHPSTISGTGQRGTNNGISCGVGSIASAPGNGNAASATHSPFSASPPNYAGQGGNLTVGNGSNPTVGKVGPNQPIASQYDVACFQAP